jgi:putative DNA primase/helicase
VLGDKDSYQNIQGVHVYEWGELDNMARAEVSKVKAFVSSPKDRFRASFDRRPRDYPRQVVFVGSVNEDHYLTDPTGNRRYWPVRCTRDVDVQWLTDNLDQMIAEALDLLDAGEKFWPSRDEQRELFDPQQLARVVPNSLEAAIREYLYDDNQRVPLGGENGTLVNTIGLKDLLQRVGYTHRQADRDGEQAGQCRDASPRLAA